METELGLTDTNRLGTQPSLANHVSYLKIASIDIFLFVE